MNEIDIDEDHDPRTGFFWASFAIEDEQLQQHCPTVTLYRNSKGKFFSARRSKPGIDPTKVILVKDPLEWLQGEIKHLKGYLP